jgi:hypothetical protein
MTKILAYAETFEKKKFEKQRKNISCFWYLLAIGTKRQVGMMMMFLCRCN